MIVKKNMYTVTTHTHTHTHLQCTYLCIYYICIIGMICISIKYRIHTCIICLCVCVYVCVDTHTHTHTQNLYMCTFSPLSHLRTCWRHFFLTKYFGIYIFILIRVHNTITKIWRFNNGKYLNFIKQLSYLHFFLIQNQPTVIYSI